MYTYAITALNGTDFGYSIINPDGITVEQQNFKPYVEGITPMTEAEAIAFATYIVDNLNAIP